MRRTVLTASTFALFGSGNFDALAQFVPRTNANNQILDCDENVWPENGDPDKIDCKRLPTATAIFA
jgi:hypothetical protein